MVSKTLTKLFWLGLGLGVVFAFYFGLLTAFLAVSP